MIALLLASCNPVKRVKEDELLLRKNTILLNENRVNDAVVEGILIQRPNSKTRLYIYNLAKKNSDSFYDARLQEQLEHINFLERTISEKQLAQIADYKKGFANWLRTTGEAPVIIDPKKAEKTAGQLQRYYDNQGYFNNEVTYEVDTAGFKERRAGLVYKINSGRPYFLDSISRDISSAELDSIYMRFQRRSRIRKGQRFDLDNFNAERERLNNLFINHGVYKFQPSSITFDIKADTIPENDDFFMPVQLNVTNMVQREGDSVNEIPYRVHQINDVNIYADFKFSDGTEELDSIHHDGYIIWYKDYLKYKPKALTNAVAINPGDIYKDNDRSLTTKQLNNLMTFKYPNITYQYADSTDALLNTNIYLTARPRFSLGFNADVSHSNIQDIGMSFSTSLVSRNVFRGAETLELALRGTIGSSSELNKTSTAFFNIAEFGGDLRLNFPRIVAPINTNRFIPKSMSPSTRMSVGTIFQKNIGLDKQSLNGNYRYSWSPTNWRKNIFDLFNIEYIRNLNPERYYDVYGNSYSDLNGIADDNRNEINPDYFDENGNLIIPEGTSGFTNDALNNTIDLTNDELEEVNRIEERRKRLTANNLIFSASFTWSKNNRRGFQDNNFYSIRTKLELAGNTLQALAGIINFDKNEDGKNLVFGVQYSQYVKTEFDYIKYWQVSRNNVLAFRTFFGIAIPYGNSNNIPFLRSYFGGGSNDNRAWEAYSLGPGSTNNLNDFNEANLKIAMNLEYRFPLIGDLKGALFADAGNIWNVLDDITLEEAKFDSLNSLADIALGTGVGFRYDFNFFVFRFDIGFKTYNPAYDWNKRWFNDYNFGNAVYNIGINYPF
ncbi:BamA/TamA family outer membrane protein [Robertkochia solimangrovi]|uniref:translocation and assembly module lipoprotein TamL n=1 Tax=Robertkochia solimangrovi TaxID=2213046 RepID=UPI001F555385|nr:BamA/TamA family outer membrane protein [Robertkochia solimangrovi]